MGRKGGAKNWFWIQVKLITFYTSLRNQILLISTDFYFKNLIFIISHFFRKKLKRNESQKEDSFQI